jgi:hypothetical protein
VLSWLSSATRPRGGSATLSSAASPSGLPLALNERLGVLGGFFELVGRPSALG